MKTLIFNGSPRKEGNTYFRKEKPIKKPKKGAVILVGGGDGSMDKAYDTARCLLRHMNACDILPAVVSHNTNNRPVAEDEEVLEGVYELIRVFNFHERKEFS